MSFYFTIPTETKVSFKALSQKISISDISFNNEPNDSENLILGTKIYIPYKSTRGITISYQDDRYYSVGINVIASEDDFHLAIQTSKTLAELTQSSVQGEDSGDFLNPEQIVTKYDQAWIDTMKTLAVDLFLDRIGNNGHILSIGCCYMNYGVGPNIHSYLDSSSEITYYNTLVEHIQKNQFF